MSELQPPSGILFEDGPSYKVRLEGFEGPLELLLHLIRKNRYDVYDIPIAQILQEYLGVLDLLRELDLDVAGEFLLMAATLAQIKSRMLLPSAVEADEAEPADDPRAELVRRLLEYEQFHEAALTLEGRPLLGRDVFAREQSPAELSTADRLDAPVEADLYDLLVAFQELLREAPDDFVQDVLRQRVSIQEAIQEILDQFQRLPPGMGLSFRDLFPPRPGRDRIVATFLALLELIRLRAARVQQVAAFGEIRIQPIPAEER